MKVEKTEKTTDEEAEEEAKAEKNGEDHRGGKANKTDKTRYEITFERLD